MTLEEILNALGDQWKICRRFNGKYEIEIWFFGDDGWSRCGEGNTVLDAVKLAARVPRGL